MNIEEAKAKFENGRTVVIGIPTWKAITGEKYVCICSGGPKKEGEPTPALYSTPKLAVSEWLRAVRNYSVGLRGTLYWRDAPDLGSVECGDHGERWTVYSRLLISDKPPLTEAEAREVFHVDYVPELKAQGLLA